MSIDRVILSNPTRLDVSAFGNSTTAPRSWVQLARTGSFTSNRYGKFSITTDDLKTMLHNFKNVTPAAPTELPVDYDHLSMDPKKPGDGAAAGWMKKLELRDGGETLWAEVEWTPDGASRIRNREYRFVSPSFVKDHVHKDGTKIGTCLLAAAITNHPFLEKMAALTLYSLHTFGDLTQFDGQRETLGLAVDVADEDVINLPFAEYDDFDDCVSKNQDKDDPDAFCGWLKHKVEASATPVNVQTLAAEWAALRTITLSEIGQRVMIAPGNARTQDEIGGTFEITEVVGDGENAFVTIKDANGVPHKWFRATELLPASATPANPIQPNLVPAPGAGGADEAGVAGGVPTADATAGVAATPGGAVTVPGEPPAPGDDVTVVATQGPEGEAAVAKGPEGKATVAKGDDAKAGATDAEPPAADDAVTSVDAQVAKAAEPAKDAAPAAVPGMTPDVEALIKKKVAAALAAGKTNGAKGPTNMMFTLRNDKNEEIKITDQQLADAGIKIVPEGSTAIPVSDLSEMKATITNLSTQVTTLSDETKAARARGVLIELHSELQRLSRGGFITKATRDALEAQFGSATDLSAFKALAATFTKPIVVLNEEHGTGVDAPAAESSDATKKLISLSNTIMKDRGLSLRDATIEAGKELAAEAEQYQSRFRPQEVGA
jgi:phage I-like protein